MEASIPDHREALKKNSSKNDIVARWVIPVRGKLYDIELEHGTISGKRVIWVNGEEVLRRDMMYRLVGEDTFFLEEKRCIIHVSIPLSDILSSGIEHFLIRHQIFPSSGFKYSYKLFVDGLECEIYNQNQSKILKTWEIRINDKTFRAVLEKDTLNIYLNGTLREEKPEFVDGGTDTQFVEDGHLFIVSARSGNRNEPICYKLTVNGAVQEVV